MSSDDSRGFRKFEFALSDALIAQLIECFDSMETNVLSVENARGIPNGQGVYQLFLNDQLVYIGKTDSDAGLQPRLLRHAAKIRSRQNLDISKVHFKAIQVLVFSAMELESMLIKHYSKISSTAWNNSGFGSNDPGRRRDDSVLKPDHFDALYPIDIDLVLDFEVTGEMSAKMALDLIKSNLPFLLRYEKTKQAANELASTTVTGIQPTDTVKNQIRTIVEQLPAGWQATALPGYIILYREEKDYRHGTILARSSSEGIE